MPKAEVVSPKANSPSGHLRNRRQKNQLAEGNSEAEGRRTNSPSGNPEAVRAEKRKL